MNTEAVSEQYDDGENGEGLDYESRLTRIKDEIQLMIFQVLADRANIDQANSDEMLALITDAWINPQKKLAEAFDVYVRSKRGEAAVKEFLSLPPEDGMNIVETIILPGVERQALEMIQEAGDGDHVIAA